jgi:hypothetical protein
MRKGGSRGGKGRRNKNENEKEERVRDGKRRTDYVGGESNGSMRWERVINSGGRN